MVGVNNWLPYLFLISKELCCGSSVICVHHTEANLSTYCISSRRRPSPLIILKSASSLPEGTSEPLLKRWTVFSDCPLNKKDHSGEWFGVAFGSQAISFTTLIKTFFTHRKMCFVLCRKVSLLN